MKRKFGIIDDKFEHEHNNNIHAKKKSKKKRKEYSSSSEEDINNGCVQDIDGIYSEDNHIYFISSVNTKSISKLVKLINKKNREFEDIKKNKWLKIADPHPIFLHITSNGGSLFEGFRAIDAIKKSILPIHTITDGRAASCGSLMAVVGKKRYMTPNSKILIHQLSSWAHGKFNEIEDDYGNCKEMMDDIIKIYVEHTKMQTSFLKKQLKHDSWWGYEKCKKNGLVDDVWK
jgi:ATP-dependent protease ClpP protease subunit